MHPPCLGKARSSNFSNLIVPAAIGPVTDSISRPRFSSGWISPEVNRDSDVAGPGLTPLDARAASLHKLLEFPNQVWFQLGHQHILCTDSRTIYRARAPPLAGNRVVRSARSWNRQSLPHLPDRNPDEPPVCPTAYGRATGLRQDARFPCRLTDPRVVEGGPRPGRLSAPQRFVPPQQAWQDTE